jgi:hypothetical protein
MNPKSRPDTIIFVMAYLSLLCLGGLFGALFVFITIIPNILEIGPYFYGGVYTMALLGIFSLLLAIVAGFAMTRLWQGKAAGRAITIMLTTGLAVISGLSVPVLLLVGLEGIALYVPLLTAVVLCSASSGVLWSLKQSPILSYFNQ